MTGIVRVNPLYKQVDRELLLRAGAETREQCEERVRLVDAVRKLEDLLIGFNCAPEENDWMAER